MAYIYNIWIINIFPLYLDHIFFFYGFPYIYIYIPVSQAMAHEMHVVGVQQHRGALHQPRVGGSGGRRGGTQLCLLVYGKIHHFEWENQL